MRLRPIPLLMLVALLPAASFAQSLGEAAAKERERRKNAKGGKVITDDELRRSGTRGTYNPPSGSLPEPSASPAAEGGAAAAATGAQAGEKPKTEEELRAEQEKAWREKLERTRAEAAQLQTQADRLQQSLNDVSGNVYGAARTRDMAALEDAKRKLAAAQQQVAALEEEGRRNRFR